MVEPSIAATAAVASVREAAPAATCQGVAADLATAEGADARAAVPEVDILVNNVGIFEPKPFEEIPDADWLRFFEVNVMSGVRLTRHYLPGMRPGTGAGSSSSPASRRCRSRPR